MTTDTGKNAPAPRREFLPLPALAFISLYLLVLAGVIVVGVVAGGHYPPIFLIFAAVFIAASGGLLLLFRWVYDLWIFSGQRQGAALVQGSLNLVFFLYLVRTEVRAKLR
jgi:hypothetical protein